MYETLLVTGATGFIGTPLCRRLVAEGHRVHGTHRSPVPGDCPDEVEWHRVDLAERDSVDRLLDEVAPDAVVHLASHVAGGRGVDLLEPTFDGNLASTVHLLGGLARSGRGRLVLTGSLEEGDPGAPPSSPYAAAKAAATAYARMAHDLWDVPVAHARLFMVYGPGQRDLRKLIPYVTLAALRGEAPRISSGTREVDWVYVDDVVDGLVALLETPAAFDGSSVDLGSGTLTSVRDVVERLLHAIDPTLGAEIGAVADRRREQVRRADVAASQARIGWRPRVGLTEGLVRTIEGYRSEVETAG